jgi:hypothetical protein
MITGARITIPQLTAQIAALHKNAPAVFPAMNTFAAQYALVTQIALQTMNVAMMFAFW